MGQLQSLREVFIVVVVALVECTGIASMDITESCNIQQVSRGFRLQYHPHRCSVGVGGVGRIKIRKAGRYSRPESKSTLFYHFYCKSHSRLTRKQGYLSLLLLYFKCFDRSYFYSPHDHVQNVPHHQDVMERWTELIKLGFIKLEGWYERITGIC